MTPVHFPALGHAVKLGKAPKRNDPRTLQLANYNTATLPAPPSSKAWGTKVPSFPMYDNDRYGNCTCAAVGHQEQVWTSNSGTMWQPTTQEVDAFYWATGDGSGRDDTGRNEVEVLNYWRNIGFGTSKRKIAGYAEVNPLNTTEVKQAHWLFGGLYIGIALPITAQSQSYWKVVPEDGSGNSQPGSWGGHAVNVTAYTSTYLTVVTWGMRLKMSWGFWRKYVDETYAILSPDWVDTTGKVAAASGFNYQALQADLQAL